MFLLLFIEIYRDNWQVLFKFFLSSSDPFADVAWLEPACPEPKHEM